MDYGYVRVSSKDQNVERQLAVMKDLKYLNKHLLTGSRERILTVLFIRNC